MPVRVDESVVEQSPAPIGRLWYAGLAMSGLTHIGIIVLLAGWSVAATGGLPADITTRWANADEPTESPTIEILTSKLLAESIAGGGRTSAAELIAQSAALAGPSRPANQSAPVTAKEDLRFTDALADDLGPLLRSVGSGSGDGQGAGNGEGDGFFGMNVAGRRFVYVVDCSLSMNHPHDSPAKTRFKRLKLELVRSIGLMQPPQEFFIVFFNEGVVPMPSRTMQPALPDVKQRYLKWVTEIRADGDTDPRDALRLAFKLQPDVIYFLTDGSFEFAAKRDLNKLSQQRIAIHTFALGNREGEPVLKALAERNRGQYHYIP